MIMVEYVARALVSIDTEEGLFDLEDLSDLRVRAWREIRDVRLMGGARGAGSPPNQSNGPGASITSAARARGRVAGPIQVRATWTVQIALLEEVSLHSIWRSRTPFLMLFEEGPSAGGRRFSLPKCEIESISANYNADGESTYEVEIAAVDWILVGQARRSV